MCLRKNTLKIISRFFLISPLDIVGYCKISWYNGYEKYRVALGESYRRVDTTNLRVGGSL